MILEGHRAFSYAAPTTYKRITPKNGCGFILARLAEHDDPHLAGLTKDDVYLGTKWYHRPGFASVLWTALLEDGLIESEDGMVEYDGNYSCFQRRGKKYARANGHYEFGRGWTVRYHLTDKGRKTFFEMMERVTENYMKKKLFGDLDKTIKTEVSPGPAERKDETWQKLDAIINDLMDLRDSLS